MAAAEFVIRSIRCGLHDWENPVYRADIGAESPFINKSLGSKPLLSAKHSLIQPVSVQKKDESDDRLFLIRRRCA